MKLSDIKTISDFSEYCNNNVTLNVDQFSCGYCEIYNNSRNGLMKCCEELSTVQERFEEVQRFNRKEKLRHLLDKTSEGL